MATTTTCINSPSPFRPRARLGVVRQRRRLAIVVPLTAALLAACSPTAVEESATDAVSTPTNGGTPDDGNANSGANAQRAAWEPGPLDEFQMRISGFALDEGQSVQDAQTRLQRQMQAMDEYIAECMAAQGFDYNFGGGGISVAIISEDDLSVPRDSLAFAQTYGFGVSTDPWGLRRTDDDSASGGSVLLGEDPNQAMLAAMSDAEREAWQEALHGPRVELDIDDLVAGAGGEWDWRRGGCSGAAFGAIWENQTPEEFTALEEEVNGFFVLVNADPRIGTLNARWGNCLADAGYPGLRDPQAINEQLFEEWANLLGLNMAFAGGAAGDGGGSAVQAEPSPEEIAAFTEREIALAVADWECRNALDFAA
ncbi:MAG: hypothetical protein FWG25_06770, partial [Promicromonosporaceae bacterium]|nr:hypothetical protein [Promicromonosporaceae bacterium]